MPLEEMVWAEEVADELVLTSSAGMMKQKSWLMVRLFSFAYDLLVGFCGNSFNHKSFD